VLLLLLLLLLLFRSYPCLPAHLLNLYVSFSAMSLSPMSKVGYMDSDGIKRGSAMNLPAAAAAAELEPLMAATARHDEKFALFQRLCPDATSWAYALLHASTACHAVVPLQAEHCWQISAAAAAAAAVLLLGQECMVSLSRFQHVSMLAVQQCLLTSGCHTRWPALV
jgi:hypothetical protein